MHFCGTRERNSYCDSFASKEERKCKLQSFSVRKVPPTFKEEFNRSWINPKSKSIGIKMIVEKSSQELRDDLALDYFQNIVETSLKYYRAGVAPVVRIYSQKLKERRRDSINKNGGRAQELCQILVVDNGIGFDEKYLDRIFTVFQRLHKKGEYEGTGVGLAICRKIVDRHGGTITARSSPGQGATFVVTMPVAQPKEIEVL